MKRDYVCRLRLIIDKLPRRLRESLFLFLIAKFIFRLPKRLFTFRQDYFAGKIKDLSLLYAPTSSIRLKRTSRDTDINSKHLKIIYEYIQLLSPKSILDVGCGTGFLLKTIDSKLRGSELRGLDFNCSQSFKSLYENHYDFTSGDVNNILKSIKTNSFEFVICAHVLEHLSNPKDLILEMRRIAKKRLIFICPLEKPYRWGLNYHVQFFETSNQFIEFVRSDNNLDRAFNYFERLGDCMYIEEIET